MTTNVTLPEHMVQRKWRLEGWPSGRGGKYEEGRMQGCESIRGGEVRKIFFFGRVG